MLKRLKIAPKLIVSFILVVSIASVSGMVGLSILLKTDNDYSNALIVNGFAQGDIGRLNTYLNKGSALIRDIVMLSDPTEISRAQTELSSIIQKTDDILVSVDENCQTPEEQALISTVVTALDKYRVSRDMVVNLGLQNRNEEALDYFLQNTNPILTQAMDAADQLADLNEQMGTEVSANLTRGTHIATAVIVVVILAAIGISLLFAFVVSRSIAAPITAVQKAAEQLEQGDLNINLSSDLGDEVGIMTRSFTEAAAQIRAYISDINRGLAEVSSGNFDITPTEHYKGDFIAICDSISLIITSLSQTMSQIGQAADQVSAGSTQVADGAQALSQGATEQASSVEELAATIGEISNQVQLTADNAKQAESLAASAGQEVENCNQQMSKMNEAMEEISLTSSQIGKIIKTIEDIAFQTNILALNAAVEAARAGSAGKGFAVVADEVRNLASKSAEAASNTTALIEGAIRAVEKGSKLADNTASSLQKVVERTGKVSETIIKISAAMEEQATNITQVTSGVDQISGVVQTNSATAQESAAASEELSSQAQMLKMLVGQFKLKDAPQPVEQLDGQRDFSSAPISSDFAPSGKY